MKRTRKKKRKQAGFRLGDTNSKIAFTQSTEHYTGFGGVPLLSKINDVFNLTKSASRMLFEDRQGSKVKHCLEYLLLQCVLLAAMGFSDTNDADKHKDDPAFTVSIFGSLKGIMRMASQATVSRFLNKRKKSELDRLEDWFLDFFIFHHQNRPLRQLKIYLDGTKIRTYGNQQGATYRGGKYGCQMYFPLTVTTGSGWLLSAKLRHGDKTEAKTVLQTLKPIVQKLRNHWPKLKITIIVDGAFKSSKLFNWCEQNDIIYFAGYSNTAAIKSKVQKFMDSVETQFRKAFGKPKYVLQNGKKDHKRWQRDHLKLQKMTDNKKRMEAVNAAKQRRVKTFCQSDHKASSWPKSDPERRTVSKIEYADDGFDCRHIVTNSEGRTPEHVYENYCQRGTSEQWIGDLKALCQPRMNCQSFNANRFKLLIDAMAYMLLFLLRRMCSQSYQKRTLPNLRSLLIEVAAQVQEKQRVLAFDLTCNFQHINEFLRVTRKLNALKS